MIVKFVIVVIGHINSNNTLTSLSKCSSHAFNLNVLKFLGEALLDKSRSLLPTPTKSLTDVPCIVSNIESVEFTICINRNNTRIWYLIEFDILV